ncbi:unnamed protein product [Adineta steineri]|uniref:Uncharacterized protein n=4 Tax=Adineta steineri TaxID=433720 RepID=A0A815NKU9_9BILA|nr:unnamed protein product [Adineta steineri]CAF4030405.1 unnamed protein product [Adineta steineri]
MTQTNCYSFLFKLSRSYPHASQNRLANIVDRVETTLNNLFHSKSITETQYNLMKINRTSVRMNYLYFVSQTHKEGIPVQPIMICNDGPTEGICRFLGRLLGLLFNDSTHCKKFHKPVNVIHEMEFYQKNGQLQPTTLFATFNIDNLCLMFSHEQVIIALERFLNHCLLSDYHIQGMTIDTILQLVRLVLDNQYFVYNYKFYKQTQGGASGSLLTIPFVHIYLFYWQHDLLNELRSILTMANTQFPQPIWNITEIGSTIHFRDIKISNHNGVLQTNVYHECMYHEPVLPPSLDLLQLPIQRNVWSWLRKSIFKAIRYCSTEYSFKNELTHIGIILNIHGFSDETFTQGHEEVIEDFGVIIRNGIAFVPTYDTMRRYLSAYDKYHQIKATQPPGPQQDINHILSKNFKNHPQIKELKIRILQTKENPFPIEHFLIKKRPDVSYLTLTDETKPKPYIY